MLTLPKFLLPFLLRLHAWAMTRPYKDIGPLDNRYMLRGWLLGYHSAARNDDNPGWHRRTRGRLHAWLTERIGIRAHVILRSDRDRALHDHPVAAVSVVLSGGYWEVGAPNEECRDRPYTYASLLRTLDKETPGAFTSFNADFNVHWRGPGSIVARSADTPHRLVLPSGTSAKTFWIMGRKTRGWGFYPGGKFVPADEYLSKEA